MKIVKLVLFSLSFYFLISCKKKDNYIISITQNNDSIKGQYYNYDSLIEYSPKGKFIFTASRYKEIWKEILIESSDKLIKEKIFFHKENFDSISYLYDNLKQGSYMIKYISCFKDTLKEKLDFNRNIALNFPKRLDTHYKKIPIRDFKIERFESNDTLQVFFQSFGCFGGGTILYEFITNENSNIKTRRFVKGLGTKKENEWEDIKVKNVEKKIRSFHLKIKEIVFDEADYCSSEIKYIFRKKSTNQIAIFEDKKCLSNRKLKFLN